MRRPLSDDAAGVLRIRFVSEVAALVGAFGLLAASVAGYTPLLDGFSRGLRLAGLVFFAIVGLLGYLEERSRKSE